ncbi:MAG: DUF2510 domain-containing protein [Lacisediminihabitans sp.]
MFRSQLLQPDGVVLDRARGGTVEPDDVVRLPAGWYPDPTGLPQLRWWDNHAWTQHTTAARQPLIVQESPLAWADDLPTRRERRASEREDRSTSDTTPQTTQSLLELDPPSEDAQPADEPAPNETESGEHLAPTSLNADGEAHPDDTPENDDDDPRVDIGVTAPGGEDPGAVFEPRSASGHAGRIPEVPPLGDGIPGLSPTLSAAPEPRMIFTALRSDPPTVGTPLFDQVAYGAHAGAPAPSFRASQPLEHQSIAGHGQNGNGMLSVPVSTAPIWIIALFPLLQLVIMLLLVTGFGAALQLNLVVPVLLGIVYLTTVALAFGDYRILKHSGVNKPAHWSWALLTSPVYLFVRAMVLTRQTGRGFGPVLVWLALAVLSVVSVVAVPGMLITTVPAVFSAQAEQSIASDAAANGATLDVRCPATPPILVGQTFSCHGTAGPGKTFEIEVSLQRSNGWIDWRVDDWGVNTLSR